MIEAKTGRGENCAFIFPITGVEFSPRVINEYRIDRVQLVHRDRLKRILRKKNREIDFPVHFNPDCVDYAACFAIIWQRTRDIRAALPSVQKSVEEEIALLALSQLARGKRDTYAEIRIGIDSGKPQWFSYCSDSLVSRFNDHQSLIIDKFFHAWCHEHFYSSLMKIIFDSVSSSNRAWKNTLRRFAILVGQSTLIQSPSEAFLHAMIGMDVLCPHDYNNHKSRIRFIEALYGWFFQPHDTKKILKRVSQQRDKIMHSGEFTQISKEELDICDFLNFHLMLFIVKHQKVIRSKQDLREYVESVEAKKVLKKAHVYSRRAYCTIDPCFHDFLDQRYRR